MSQKSVASRLIVLSLMTVMAAVQLGAQNLPTVEPEESTSINRVLGDQYLAIALGMQIPLFIHNPSPSTGEKAINPVNISAGLGGSLGWAAFLNNSLSLGLDVSAAFGSDPNGDPLFTVPLGIQTSYYALRIFPFEVPLHLGTGINIMRYKDVTTFGFMAKAGASFYWNAVQDWAFGLNVMYWWLPEIYGSADGSPPSSMTRFGNFLEVTLSALYNF